MRWLLIALLASVGVLLLAAAGMVRHVLLHRREMKRLAAKRDGAAVPEESDLESES